METIKYYDTSDERSPWAETFSRFGKHGRIEARFWATRNRETGELSFNFTLPNAVRHFEEDFDTCILVLAWGLWGLSAKIADHQGTGELTVEGFCKSRLKRAQFIEEAIEVWLHKAGRLMFAEGYSKETDISDDL